MTAQPPGQPPDDPVAAAVASLLDGTARARREFAAAIDGLSDEQRRTRWSGDWSLYEIVAHIAAWQDGFAAALEHAVRGERPQVPGYESSVEDATDRYNAAAAAAVRDATWDDLIARLDASAARHDAAVRSVAGALTAERFEDGRSARRLATASNHYDEHIPQILDWRRREGI